MLAFGARRLVEAVPGQPYSFYVAYASGGVWKTTNNGGSFEPLGGQNLIEAAACGCPVLMGPHTFNFSEAAELAQREGAAQRVAHIGEAVRIAAGLAAAATTDIDARRAGARTSGAAPSPQNALAFSARHRGAARRMVRQIDALIG